MLPLGVIYTVGATKWSELREAYFKLCGDLQWKVISLNQCQRCNVLMVRVQVRRPLAHSLHEVAVIIGGETAVADLLPIFETFLKDLDEVLPLLLASFCGLNRDITRFCRLKLGWFDIWQRSCTSFLPTLESSTFL